MINLVRKFLTYRHAISIALIAMLFAVNAVAQSSRPSTSGRSSASSQRAGAKGGRGSDRDSSSVAPRGLTTWRVDERFGTVIPTVPDTMPHLFQNSNLTEGPKGNFSHTGNLGSPRVSRIYNGQQDYAMGSQFLFARPYDMVLGSINDCIFTNTKSPITNLSWMTQGNKFNGYDRLRANFATNVNKQAGIGFKIDYLYGQGYFTHQQQSSLGAKIFGSYRSDRYQLHATYTIDKTKNAENGGLSDETYITHPEYYSTKYQPADMPVRLRSAYNRMRVNTLFLTHRYNLGYYNAYDPEGNVLTMPAASDSDSVAVAIRAMFADSTTVRRFIPVAAFVHTAKLEQNRRRYIDNDAQRAFYIDNFFPENDSINDLTRYLSLENTFALEMSEGFKKWVKTGMRLYAKHQLMQIGLPDEQRQMRKDVFNYITVGGQLMREQGDIFHYNVLGELRTTGEDWGEFNVEGNIKFDIPIRRDSIALYFDGFVRNELPSYYYRHYHATNAWWDNALSKVFRTRLQGQFIWRKTRLKVGFETIQNHTFFQQFQQLPEGTAEPEPGDFSNVMYGIGVQQAGKNVQLLQAALCQDFKLGPLMWENEVTYQQTSDDKVLPIPMVNVWSNLYLHFKIAKVLYTDLGADVRYFTKYYAPAYVPFMGQYAVQDEAARMKLGGYPWVNVYANFHLKTCRFYIMYSHVNCGSGPSFLAPHYPTDRRAFRVGISWNFFN